MDGSGAPGPAPGGAKVDSGKVDSGRVDGGEVDGGKVDSGKDGGWLETECVICLEGERTHLVVPCGHVRSDTPPNLRPKTQNHNL